MIIDSPVGRFPFEVERLTAVDGKLRLQGSMGAWPTSVELAPAELPGVAWRLLGPRGGAVLAVPAGIAALRLLVRRGTRR